MVMRQTGAPLRPGGFRLSRPRLAAIRLLRLFASDAPYPTSVLHSVTKLCLDRDMKKPTGQRRGAPRRGARSGYLEGQLLVAMPTMTDRRFQRSVIYMCAHSKDGAMGLIINQRAPKISFSSLLQQLDVLDSRKPAEMPLELHDMDVHIGGPVETGRGFVLHSADYHSADSTLQIDTGISLTATIDILRAMATGVGPDRALLALGYAGWSAGQLEAEIHANGWLNCPADNDLVFDPDLERKYTRAIGKIGIDLTHLSSEAGHA